jgi:hypothetical protein
VGKATTICSVARTPTTLTAMMDGTSCTEATGWTPSSRGEGRVAETGERDYINCGPGKDTVQYAREDKVVNCENKLIFG